MRIEGKIITFSKDGPVQEDRPSLALGHFRKVCACVRWRGNNQVAKKYDFHGIPYLQLFSAVLSPVRIEGKIITFFKDGHVQEDRPPLALGYFRKAHACMRWRREAKFSENQSFRGTFDFRPFRPYRESSNLARAQL